MTDSREESKAYPAKRASLVQFEFKGPNPYFEVKVVKGDGNEFVIGVGFGLANYRPGSFPGWRTNSYGVHGDDGGFFDGHPYIIKNVTQPWVVGDVIGCGINPMRREMFWTLNGNVVYTQPNIVLLMYHAIIGMRQAKDCIEVNFGMRPFIFQGDNLPDAKALIAGTGLKSFDNKDVLVKSLVDESQNTIWKVEVINTCKLNVLSDVPLLVPFPSHAEGTVYYEIEVVSGSTGNGAIGLGWGLPPVSRDMMPGWMADSYGYHSDDGCLYREQGWPLDAYGPKFQTGDFVGCGIERGPGNKLQIFYTVNGKHLGVAFRSVPQKNYVMFVGFIQSNACVRINTSGPFVYPFQYQNAPEKPTLLFEGVQYQLNAPVLDVIEFTVRTEVGQIFGAKSLLHIPENEISKETKIDIQTKEAFPVSKAMRMFNFKEVLIEHRKLQEMTKVVTVEQWIEDKSDDQNVDKLIRRVFDFVDEDCNGALGHLETCIGLCYLLGKECLEPSRLIGTDGGDMLPQQAKFKEIDKEQFKSMFFELLSNYMVKNSKGEDLDIRKNVDENMRQLVVFFDTTPVERRVDSVGCTRLLVDTGKRLFYFCAYILFPFVFLKSCLQDLILDDESRKVRKCGVLRDILLGVVGIFVFWPLIVVVYYVGLVGPILYGVNFPAIRDNGHLVSGTEIVVPLVGILMVLFFALKNGWGSEESLGILRKLTGVYDAVMDKEFDFLKIGRSEIYIKAWEKRLRPFRDYLVTVDVFSLQGVKEQMRLGTIMAKMKGEPSNRWADLIKRVTVKYILPVVFAIGAGIVPGLVRVIKLKAPFFGETRVEIAIAALYLGLTIPIFYLVLNGLSNIISEHARQLKLYRTLRDVTTAKGVSTTSQLKFYVDLNYSRNIDKWMEMRKTAIEDQRHKDRSQFLVGPILIANICLTIAVLYRVLSRLSPAEILNAFDNAVDISNILAIYLLVITFGYIFALLVVMVQQNEMISVQHIKMMTARKYRMARNMWDVDDGEKDLLRRQIIVLESAINRVQVSENRVEILGVVVDRRFAISVSTTVLTGVVTGVLRIVGAI